MDDVLQFCSRVLIDPALALDAATAVGAEAHEDRLAALAAAGRACRERAPRVAASQDGGLTAQVGGDAGESELGAAIARELATACAQLAERHRETLALRELLGLSYAEIAMVIRVEPAAVGPLLARARLRLRATLRGPFPSADRACEHSDRAVRALARRQDHEPIPGEEEDWLLDHLGGCEHCGRAHAAMLEASACYRAWPPISTAGDPASTASA